nr:ribonuclease E/G [Nocardioidaceae bacterium]
MLDDNIGLPAEPTSTTPVRRTRRRAASRPAGPPETPAVAPTRDAADQVTTADQVATADRVTPARQAADPSPVSAGPTPDLGQPVSTVGDNDSGPDLLAPPATDAPRDATAKKAPAKRAARKKASPRSADARGSEDATEETRVVALTGQSTAVVAPGETSAADGSGETHVGESAELAPVEAAIDRKPARKRSARKRAMSSPIADATEDSTADSAVRMGAEATAEVEGAAQTAVDPGIQAAVDPGIQLPPAPFSITEQSRAATEGTAGQEQRSSGRRRAGAPPVALLFKAPDPNVTPAVSRDTPSEAEVAGEAPVEAAVGVEPSSPSRTSTDSAGESGEAGDGGDGASNRRRRSRGGRNRRKGTDTGGPDAAVDDDDASTDKATASDESRRAATDDREAAADARADRSQDKASGSAASQTDAAQTQDEPGGTDDEVGSSRRRRRRRRGGEDSADADAETEGTVVRVRAPRAKKDTITNVEGSTRIEAKRQRRREGRDAGRRRPPILSESEFLARRESVERVMAIRQRGETTQIGVLEDDVLVEHYVAIASQSSIIGNVYLGRVQNVLPSMEAAFIDIGRGRNAVLYAGEVNWENQGNQPRRIENVLKSGQTVLVQVSKDPVGHKGARLTSQISLPGRYLVYVPSGGQSGISRKLADTERSRLKRLLKDIIPDEAGVIIRTAAEGASEDELTRDVTRLTARWEDIEKKIKSGQAPTLLYAEPDTTLKVVRDLFTEDFTKLVISGDDAWDMVDGYVQHVAPDLADRLERYEGEGDV